MSAPEIRTEAELDAALAAPRLLLLKHSHRCPVSHAARAAFEAFVAAHPDVPAAWIDVIGARPLSLRVAATTGVVHESPQAFWLAAGRPLWHASHDDVTEAALAAATRDA